MTHFDEVGRRIRGSENEFSHGLALEPTAAAPAIGRSRHIQACSFRAVAILGREATMTAISFELLLTSFSHDHFQIADGGEQGLTWRKSAEKFRCPSKHGHARLLQQVRGVNPFAGDCLPTRVPLFGFGRPTLPFPHLWNYKNPIKIFETFYWDAEKETGSGKHNRYIYVAGLPPVLLTREPAVIKAVLGATGDKPGQFDRDQSPMAGIARATGKDSLLYSNGPVWRRQKRLSAEPFSRANLFQPEKFHGFEQTFRKTVAERLEALRSLQQASGKKVSRIQLEPEIKVVMLEMLVNNFFGGSVSEKELRDRFVPALEILIDHMISDTVAPGHSGDLQSAYGPQRDSQTKDGRLRSLDRHRVVRARERSRLMETVPVRRHG